MPVIQTQILGRIVNMFAINLILLATCIFCSSRTEPHPYWIIEWNLWNWKKYCFSYAFLCKAHITLYTISTIKIKIGIEIFEIRKSDFEP